MNPQARQLGEYIRSTRKVQRMSIRTLAAKAGIDSGGLARLECGKVPTPQPNTLQKIALSLHISLFGLFAKAGYVVPQDLPDVGTYLHLKYQSLPEAAVAAIIRELEQLAARYGDDSADIEGRPIKHN